MYSLTSGFQSFLFFSLSLEARDASLVAANFLSVPSSYKTISLRKPGGKKNRYTIPCRPPRSLCLPQDEQRPMSCHPGRKTRGSLGLPKYNSSGSEERRTYQVLSKPRF